MAVSAVGDVRTVRANFNARINMHAHATAHSISMNQFNRFENVRNNPFNMNNIPFNGNNNPYARNNMNLNSINYNLNPPMHLRSNNYNNVKNSQKDVHYGAKIWEPDLNLTAQFFDGLRVTSCSRDGSLSCPWVTMSKDSTC